MRVQFENAFPSFDRGLIEDNVVNSMFTEIFFILSAFIHKYKSAHHLSAIHLSLQLNAVLKDTFSNSLNDRANPDFFLGEISNSNLQVCSS